MKLIGRFNDNGWGNDLGNRALKIPRNTFREGFLMAGAISDCDRWPRKKKEGKGKDVEGLGVQ